MKVIRALFSTWLLVFSVGAVINNSAKLLAATPDCTPPPAGLVAWWPGEGNAQDIAGGNNGVWAGFGGLNQYTSGTVGQAFVFDGTHRDRVNVGNPASLQLQNFTIEAWVKRASATVASLDENFADGSIAGPGGYIFGYGAGGYGLFLSDAGEIGLTKNSTGDVRVPPAITDTNWHHVAVTKSGTSVAFYVDGVLQPTPTPATDTHIFEFTTSAALGSRGDGGGNTFYGKVDELSIYDHALSISEVDAIYNAGNAGKCASAQICATAPNGLLAWWPGENNAHDVVGGNNGTLLGGTTFTAGKVGQGFDFNGNGPTCVNIPYNPNLITSNYTVEAWINPTAQVTGGIGQTLIFGQSFGHVQLVVRTGTTGVRVVFQFGVNHYSFYQVQSTGEIPISQFTHVAGTWDGTKLRLYINGVLNAESTPGTSPVDSGCDFFIGGFNSPEVDSCQYAGQFFQGTVDELSYYNRALSSNEIASIYNAGDAGKCGSPGCVSFPNFNSVNGLTLTGTTAATNNFLRLTPATDSQTGDAWLTGKTACTNGFDTSFHFRITQLGNIYGNEPGGDGFTFSVQNVSQTNNAWAMGDPNNFVAVFFNTFWNWPGCTCPDVSGNSVGILINQSYIAQTDLNSFGINMSDGSIHLGRVAFDGSAMTVWVDGRMVLTNVPVPGLQPGVDDTGNAWVGFTAGTGAAYENHDILDWSFCNNGSSQSLTNTLTGVPDIYNFSPNTGTNGTVLAIVGANFSPSVSSNIVYFGAVQAQVLAATTTSLTVVVPTGAIYAPITVTVNGLTASSGQSFEPTFMGDGSNISPSSFRPSFNLPTGNGPGSMVIADLDGDGKPDLAEVNGNEHTLSIFQNISAGGTLNAASFAPRVNLLFPSSGVGGNPYRLRAVDLDGDGRLDLIACEVSGNHVTVFHNIATPGALTTNSFAAGFSLIAGSDCRFATAADLDHDGRVDIVALNYGAKTISLFKNIGTAGTLTPASFASPVTLAAPGGPYEAVATDLNGDGKPDLAVANSDSGTVSVYQNVSLPGSLSPNSFATPFDMAAGDTTAAIVAADVDGDGKLDLVAGSVHSHTISLFQNVSHGGMLTTNSFAPRVDFPTSDWTHTLAIADFNGDGKPDINVVGELPSLMAIFQNTSVPGVLNTNSLASRVDFGTGWNAWGVAAGDLDGDGRPDIVFCNDYDANIQIYQNRSPSAATPVITMQPTNQTVVAGDTASFYVDATGLKPLTFQWMFNGSPITDATNKTMVIPEAQPAQAGDYSVMVANAAGSLTSSNATLMVTIPDCTPPPSGLVGWWPGEGNGQNIVSGNTSILSGELTFTNGKVGQAFLLNSTNAYFHVPSKPSLNVGLSSGFTIEAWIKPSNVNGLHPIVEWNNGSGGIGVQFWIGQTPWSQGVLCAFVMDTNGNNYIQVPSPNGALIANSWQHVATTYDRTTHTIKVYINGTVVAQSAWTGDVPQTSYDLWVGQRPADCSGCWTDGTFLSGPLDELSLYNRALSSNEIAAIYAARGTGKCPLPPKVLSVTPTNYYVNEGATVAYTVTAAGSPTLTYQWQRDGSDIPEATNSTLTLSNVVYSQAGNYDVVVSGPGGWAVSSNVVLRVNRAPIADASATEPLAISPNATNAVVVLDGSKSSDPDGDALTYAWLHTGDTSPFASGVVAMQTLPLGTNQLTLSVNDSMASASQAFAVEVITTSQAIDRLAALAQSGSGNIKPLVASLEAALAAIDRTHPQTAINQLEAFINKVQAQLEPSDPALAAQLIADAQAIIDALNGGTLLPAAQEQMAITSITHGHNGQPHLKVKGANGHIHVVETSTNMVDWVPVGVATQNSDGTYEFDDTQSQETGARFYRVVTPQ